MIPHALRRRWPAIIRWGIAHGFLPFAAGARATYLGFRRCWPNGAPATLNEKIQYKMIHDRRPVVKIYSDKLAARDYVQARMPSLRLPRVLGVFASEADVLAHVPAGPWVLKASHGAAMVLIQKPSVAVDRETIARRLREWQATDYSLGHWEWQYFRLPHRFFFEEYLGTEANPPADYKFYVIHQKVRLATVDQGRFGKHTRDLFTPEWTHLQSRKGAVPHSTVPPERPALLTEMIAIAEALAQGHDFIRVDLYVVDGTIYFGELTHSPAAGTVPCDDPELELQLGRHWRLPARYRE